MTTQDFSDERTCELWQVEQHVSCKVARGRRKSWASYISLIKYPATDTPRPAPCNATRPRHFLLLFVKFAAGLFSSEDIHCLFVTGGKRIFWNTRERRQWKDERRKWEKTRLKTKELKKRKKGTGFAYACMRADLSIFFLYICFSVPVFLSL